MCLGSLLQETQRAMLLGSTLDDVMIHYVTNTKILTPSNPTACLGSLLQETQRTVLLGGTLDDILKLADLARGRTGEKLLLMGLSDFLTYHDQLYRCCNSRTS